LGEKANFLCYYVVSPVFFVLGLLFHGLCLKAFYKQAKTEQPYAYQIFTTVSETLEVGSWLVYVVGYKLLASGTSLITAWYRRCYGCMWFSATLGTSLFTSFITMSELFAICMSVDRMYALARPLAYNL